MRRDRGRAETRCHGVTGYLAECLWPGVTEKDIAERDALAMVVAPASGPDGGARYLGALFVPSDEVVFFFFEGPSLGSIRRAIEGARIPSDRILKTRRWRVGSGVCV